MYSRITSEILIYCFIENNFLSMHVQMSGILTK